MESCPICHIFIQDWFTQPLSPQHTIYKDIHPKRLVRILPEITPIFIRFIKDLTFYDLTGIFFAIERILMDATMDMMFESKDVIDDLLLRLSWTSMTDHYIRKAPGDISLIEDIMKEACICKSSSNEKELIGYYLTNMIINMKEVHTCHVSSRPPEAPENTYISVSTVKDDLYD